MLGEIRTMRNQLLPLVFGRISQEIANSNLQAQKFALSETALWETALGEGCL